MIKNIALECYRIIGAKKFSGFPPAYTPGPLSTYKEYNLDHFLRGSPGSSTGRWYLHEMKTALGK